MKFTPPMSEYRRNRQVDKRLGWRRVLIPAWWEDDELRPQAFIVVVASDPSGHQRATKKGHRRRGCFGYVSRNDLGVYINVQFHTESPWQTWNFE